jgi:hypothetical protein
MANIQVISIGIIKNDIILATLQMSKLGGKFHCTFSVPKDVHDLWDRDGRLKLVEKEQVDYGTAYDGLHKLRTWTQLVAGKRNRRFDFFIRRGPGDLSNSDHFANYNISWDELTSKLKKLNVELQSVKTKKHRTNKNQARGYLISDRL